MRLFLDFVAIFKFFFSKAKITSESPRRGLNLFDAYTLLAPSLCSNNCCNFSSQDNANGNLVSPLSIGSNVETKLKNGSALWHSIASCLAISHLLSGYPLIYAATNMILEVNSVTVTLVSTSITFKCFISNCIVCLFLVKPCVYLN